ncbi:biotin/lipoyl-binding carrier protein [Luteipulveratus sp. YIM 133132]|uniref:Biotin/lipoyl-binding carrier protein n=1 Tax=Luteipulveratus flavus TaxID=3031728 RepID=A0ABT6C4V5_9MICO|nr:MULTISPECIES: biotin/lipoyl-binding carrier protein [unclassified Luteipulveratus]MDE9365356.1 biotin/lipoyl-binding carrier protein [Luteipulveratus sp. YIM 133132]MDF8263858.1 biotin/lipoyl-binding carrier protein [Luteipulveratus sp. YIM 133296]
MPVTQPQEIASDLVANVAQIHVTVGQQVEAGEEVALLESMKMEIPVVAELPGTVTDVRVHPGDVVQEGDVLVVLA